MIMMKALNKFSKFRIDFLSPTLLRILTFCIKYGTRIPRIVRFQTVRYPYQCDLGSIITRVDNFSDFFCSWESGIPLNGLLIPGNFPGNSRSINSIQKSVSYIQGIPYVWTHHKIDYISSCVTDTKILCLSYESSN